MPHTFQRADKKDIFLIQALACQIWREAYKEILSREQIDYMLEMMYSENIIKKELSNDVVWEIIFEDGRPCGFLSYSLQGNRVKLSKLYTGSHYRGGTIAREAITRVARFADENKKVRVYLTVNKNNKRAIRAYEKNGFLIVDSVITDIGGGFVMDDYVMEYFVNSGQAPE